MTEAGQWLFDYVLFVLNECIHFGLEIVFPEVPKCALFIDLLAHNLNLYSRNE